MKRLILIDSHAVIHRAYHALPPLTTPGGEPTNAVYGFTTILLRMLRELKPDYVAAAFDMAAPTFRHIAYERYKAQRPETPSDLSSQFSKVKEILTAFGIPVFEKEGFEADDVIGTIAKKLERHKTIEVIIVTGDMDALQLVGPRLKVYSMKKGISDTVLYDEKAVRERYGLKPNQLVDFKGLKGDPSDNIAGVKGIGEKTATELIRGFGSVAGVYAALKKGTKKISPSVADKLRAGSEDALLSKELATINRSVPLEFLLQKVAWSGVFDSPAIRAVFQKFGFFSLLKRLSDTNVVSENPATKKLEPQGGSQQLLLEPSVPTAGISLIRSRNDISAANSKGAENGLVVHEDTLFLIRNNNVCRILDSFLKTKDARSFFSEREFFVHDAKTVIHFLRKYGIELGTVVFDNMLAAYLVSSFSRDFSYPALAAREFGRVVAASEEEFVHFFDLVCSLDAKLNVGTLRKIFEEIELPLSRILADMEERGVLVGPGFLGGLSKKVDKKIQGLTGEIYKSAGTEFNIKSTQQLSRILFEKLKIKTSGLRKTEKGGVISTRESELVKLKGTHSIVEKILDYRELAKLKTTYINVLPSLINPKTGRVHTTFNQTGTTTGRLSSSDPNLQNIPILSEYGREVRKAFVAPKGYEFVSFDYSQIELRVAAHIAGDPKMIEAFRRGLDIHTMTAAEINNIPIKKVTPDLRRAAKTLNFGILYGMGSQALAESTGMPRDDAKKFIDEYFRDFAGIRKYIEDTKRFAEEHGYVETIFGRRRYIPEIHSPNWQMKREAERMAINMPIQGSATGDIIKMAMIKVDEWIKKEKLGAYVRLLLQVHDELLFEIEKDAVKTATPKIKEIMEGVTELKVPLVVDVKIGPNWGEQLEL